MKSDQLFVTLYTLSIYPSAHKQLRRHHPNPFLEDLFCTRPTKDLNPNTFSQIDDDVFSPLKGQCRYFYQGVQRQPRTS